MTKIPVLSFLIQIERKGKNLQLDKKGSNENKLI